MKDIREVIPNPFWELLTPNRWRYKVYYGGRGSGKSMNAARACIVLCDTTNMQVLYAREYQNSLDQSSYRDLSEQIKSLGLEHRFEILKTEIRNTHTGSLIRFKGLSHQDGQSIKSYSGYDLVVIEEGATISETSWENLDPTIRKPNSEIWVLFNPVSEDDAIYKRFVLNPPSSAYVRKINFDENTYFPDVLEKQRLEDLQNNPRLYPHKWLGECRAIGDAVIPIDALMVGDKPAQLELYPFVLFAVIDSAVKAGGTHDGTGIVYFAKYKHHVPSIFGDIKEALLILDYDKVQIEGAFLEHWLQSVMKRLQMLANELKANSGYGVFIEDRASGTMLLQKAATTEYANQVQAIDSKLTALGKEVRAVNALPYLTSGAVKITEAAYNKATNFKGENRNHLIKELRNFVYGRKDQEDDLVDCFTYGIALGLNT